jgi:hypothetical protein
MTTQRAPGGAGDRGRYSSRRKLEAVLRLLRGEDLDKVSRELGVSGAVLALWREKVLAGGGLPSRTGLKTIVTRRPAGFAPRSARSQWRASC